MAHDDKFENSSNLYFRGEGDLSFQYKNLPSESFLLVWDLDDTLIFYDQHAVYNRTVLYYKRPFVSEVLEIVLKMFGGIDAGSPGNLFNVLWTNADTDYAFDVLQKFNLLGYFNLILTRPDSNKSEQTYGSLKCPMYITQFSQFKEWKGNDNYISVLIDDKVVENTGILKGEFTYTRFIIPKPYIPNKPDAVMLSILDNLEKLVLQKL